MSERQHIYIGEVYCNGQRVEQIAHTTRDGAQEDVDVSAAGYDGDVETEIHKRRLYRGPEGIDPVTFFASDAEDKQAIKTNEGP